MEEATGSKRRRVYSFNPNAMTFTNFSRKYMSYLLPALLGAINGGINAAKREKIVRFEVDLALALSTREFKWGRALKRELAKEAAKAKCGSNFVLDGRLSILEPSPAIPRPIALVGAKSRRRGSIERGSTVRGEEELSCRIRALRRILPGGREMSVLELLSEVESYVVCLQLQVGALRSLVEP